jgi:DNA-binding NtrC family response regulator
VGKIQWLDVEGNLFGEVYRLNAAMSAASDVSAAITSLLQALKETLPHSIVVVTGLDDKLTCHPIRMSISDDLRKRILSISSSAGDKPYMSGNGFNRRMGVMWVPIRCLTLTGGIYVEPASGELLVDEREIEFLTVVAAIAESTLYHLCSKKTAPPRGCAVNSYGIVGASAQIRDVCARIEIAGSNSAAVLIEGESGTGKELVARAVHQQSKRGRGPFVPVDCGALPDGLIESELFGAKKGAYTGAITDRPGLFEAANQGTIFLDEIANLGLTAQAKLLRVLQEREIRKIGSTTGKTVDVRLIAATNCNLERLVREGKFRHDLLYRLKVLHIPLPALRDRKDDIPILATAFLERLNTLNQARKYFGPRVMEKFIRHDYPGNVRELQNAVERGFYTSSKSVISDVEFFAESIQTNDLGDKETETWFRDLTEGRQNFWSGVHDRYKRRDISRERVVALIDLGLRTTGGSYKTMASMFQIPNEQYHRFMDFLRRSKCHLDFRPYRRGMLHPDNQPRSVD